MKCTQQLAEGDFVPPVNLQSQNQDGQTLRFRKRSNALGIFFGGDDGFRRWSRINGRLQCRAPILKVPRLERLMIRVSKVTGDPTMSGQVLFKLNGLGDA